MTPSENSCSRCGKEVKESYFLLCAECTPYFYGKGKFPHQKARKTMEWDLKRAKRLAKAESKCEWCGEEPEQGITIHHSTKFDILFYKHAWFEIIEQHVNKLRENDEYWKIT